MEILNMKNADLMRYASDAVKKHLGAEVRNIKCIGGGSNGKAFKTVIDDGRYIVVKAFREQGNQNKEASQLRILSANTSVTMPEVLFVHADEKSALMGMTFIEGKNALDPMFLFKGKAQKLEFAQAVVDGVSQWHKVTGEKFGELDNPRYTSWCEFYRSEKLEPWIYGLDKLCREGKYGKNDLELLKNATRIFDEICEEPENPVLIHGDLNIMNIMADPKTMRLTGFIDPSGSMWADREYDLYQFLNMWGGCFGIYEKYKEVHNLSELSDFRVAYYAAIHEAACRLGGGLIFPIWEKLNNMRLKKIMDKY